LPGARPDLQIAREAGEVSIKNFHHETKEPEMKTTTKSILFALAACLLATTALTAELQAEDKKKPKEVADFEAGIAAYEANDLPLAYKEFLAAAKEGHADSQFNVALMYEKGIGIGKDEKEAGVWYDKSASQGNSAAQFNLGVIYENGRGTKVDFAKANEWYRKASVQGDALGMLYVRGQGVKENKTAGVALLLVAATRDPSPENHAKRNIAGTRGLSAEMIAAAQSLSGEMSSANNLLVPLDQYLQRAEQESRIDP
jgi:TPR repeat protein